MSTEPWGIYCDDIMVECESIRANAHDPDALAQLIDVRLEIARLTFQEFCLTRFGANVAKQGKPDPE